VIQRLILCSAYIIPITNKDILSCNLLSYDTKSNAAARSIAEGTSRVPNGRRRTGPDLVSTVKVKSSLKVEIRPTGQS